MLAIPAPVGLSLAHLVLDFNGTLACEGKLLPGVAWRLHALGGQLAIHVVTGDTFGHAREELAQLPCKVQVLAPGAQSQAKQAFVQALGPHHVACIGNGRNDLLMMQSCALAICVLQAEGAAAATLAAADVVAASIEDALDLLLQPLRLVATLRP
jgi:soluble P-type ATPase